MNQFDRICIIQNAGIGDIIFAQKIAHKLHEHYQVPIFWPVKKEIAWIKEYLDTPFNFFPDSTQHEFYPVTCQPFKLPIVVNRVLYIPIQRAFGGPSIVLAKFNMCNLTIDDWQDYVHIKRYKDREDTVYAYAVQRKPYTFVNNMFATQPETMISSFVPTKFPNPVYLNFLPNVTLFDWLRVIQEAEEVHIVSSGLAFIIDALSEIQTKLFIYNRQSVNDSNELPMLKLRKNWNIK